MGMILQSMVMMGNKLNNHILMKREKENNHGFIQYINIDRRPCIIFVWYECNGRWPCEGSGGKLEKILENLTSNPIKAVLLGAGVTAVIQSSSATTVMVVGFVNSGIMKLSQAVGVIMGANIGTTVTAWIISALGFKVDIAAFALPLLAFGIPLLFSQKSNRKSVGEFIFGFPFLFMGLSYLKNNVS